MHTHKQQIGVMDIQDVCLMSTARHWEQTNSIAPTTHEGTAHLDIERTGARIAAFER